MPIYQYKCKKCGQITEKMQKISDKPITKCLYCGANVEKIISAPGIIFKGSGFHVTDYQRGKKHTEKEVSAKQEAKTASCASNCPAPCKAKREKKK